MHARAKMQFAKTMIYGYYNKPTGGVRHICGRLDGFFLWFFA